jgi:hypothetical protein
MTWVVEETRIERCPLKDSENPREVVEHIVHVISEADRKTLGPQWAAIGTCERFILFSKSELDGVILPVFASFFHDWPLSRHRHCRLEQAWSSLRYCDSPSRWKDL